MIRSLMVAGALALGITGVIAQSDVIKSRQDAMKAIGAANKPAVGMLKGVAPFNLATVQASLRTFSEQANKSLTLYPAGSNQGETAALPSIWKNKADFDNKMKALAADAATALKAISDEASFKANFPAVLKNCGGCHGEYRRKS
ncbi:MAG: cytochrome c [Alphaproteobacteria bacterium]|nr:cytochrome c [Alphaproteobacteria bacterium]